MRKKIESEITTYNKKNIVLLYKYICLPLQSKINFHKLIIIFTEITISFIIGVRYINGYGRFSTKHISILKSLNIEILHIIF